MTAIHAEIVTPVPAPTGGDPSTDPAKMGWMQSFRRQPRLPPSDR